MKIPRDQGERTKHPQIKQKLNKGSLAEWLGAASGTPPRLEQKEGMTHIATEVRVGEGVLDPSIQLVPEKKIVTHPHPFPCSGHSQAADVPRPS